MNQTRSAGRRPITTRAVISDTAIELFSTHGFESTSVDDIAEAVGIGRRTLFRYYPSKNAIAWGEFDDHLDDLRRHLDALPAETTLADGLRQALVDFNTVPPEYTGSHRRRMTLLLTVPALQAHSMIMYADWRQVIADFCARKLGLAPTDHLPQTLGWLALGVALAAYEQWLNEPHAQLVDLLDEGARTLVTGLAALD